MCQYPDATFGTLIVMSLERNCRQSRGFLSCFVQEKLIYKGVLLQQSVTEFDTIFICGTPLCRGITFPQESQGYESED